MKNGYIDFNADANYGDQELYNRWMGDNNLHKGQVVFTTEAPMGNVAQIPNDALYILSQRTIAFEVKHHLIREDFLATLLRSPKIFNELTFCQVEELQKELVKNLCQISRFLYLHH